MRPNCLVILPCGRNSLKSLKGVSEGSVVHSFVIQANNNYFQLNVNNGIVTYGSSDTSHLGCTVHSEPQSGFKKGKLCQ
jgi:hypothetical protein